MSKIIETFVIQDMIVTVELVNHNNNNAQASYTVTAPNTLTPESIEKLRAAGAFMYDQKAGLIMSGPTKQEDGSFMYTVNSSCDSGD